MRLRQLVLACGLSSLMLSQYASALGLGEITLRSALNQPLSAEIKLLDTRELSAEQIVVALASPVDFERNGLDRLFFYTEFQFEVQLEAPDGPKVIVTSRSPVREPYLNFLIEARWTAGRLLREYTLLMDLPTFDDTAPVSTVTTAAPRAAEPPRPAPAPSAVAPVQPSAAPSRPAATSTRTEPAAQPSQAKQQSARPAAAALSGDSYQVQANDTLWQIARSAGGSGASVHQAMMAIYEANPEAFINGNINLLRRGQVLRIPSGEQMQSRSRGDAVRQFAAQIGDTQLGAQLSGSRRSSTATAEPADAAGRVKLAAPGAGNGDQGQGSGANLGRGVGLESELAGTLEELDKSKAENTELTSRVRDLEAQIHTMERLVEVSNEKLRTLQVAAQQTQAGTEPATSAAQESPAVQPGQSQAVVEQPIVEPPVEQPIVDAPTGDETGPNTTDEAAPVAPEPVAAPVAASAASSSAAAVVAPSVVRSAPKPSLVDQLVENAPWIGLGIAVVAGGGILAYRRRKQEQEDAQASESLDDDGFRMDSSLDEEEVPDFGVPEDFERQVEADADLDLDASDDDVSVVDKADLHIAFGQLDKAESLLLKGLDKEPNSAEIRLKLLEVYSQERDLAAFDKHYALLSGVGAAALMARAGDLRAAIPGAGEFTPSADSFGNTSGGDSFDADLADLSLDDFTASSDSDRHVALDLADESLELDLAGDTAFDAPVAASTAVSDEAWDFALDDSLPLQDKPAASASLADDELSLDDLDLSFDALDAFDGVASTTTTASDGLSELSLALDDLDKDLLPLDVRPVAPEAEFSLELEGLADAAPAAEPEESLEVAADDFNLDLDARSVDLAALDSELDAFDEKAGNVNERAGDTAGDLGLGSFTLDEPEAELLDTLGADSLGDLSLDTLDFDAEELGVLEVPESLQADLGELDSAFNALELDVESELGAELADDNLHIPNSGLHLTDDLDTSAGELGLDDDLADLDAALNELAPPAQVAPKAAAVTAPLTAEDDVFAQALSGFSSEPSELDFTLSDEDMDAELDFLAEADEAATKLDLARAYIDMGDAEGAKDILTEVVSEGNDEQRAEAEQLLGRIDV